MVALNATALENLGKLVTLLDKSGATFVGSITVNGGGDTDDNYYLVKVDWNSSLNQHTVDVADPSDA